MLTLVASVLHCHLRSADRAFTHIFCCILMMPCCPSLSSSSSVIKTQTQLLAALFLYLFLFLHAQQALLLFLPCYSCLENKGKMSPISGNYVRRHMFNYNAQKLLHQHTKMFKRNTQQVHFLFSCDYLLR